VRGAARSGAPPTRDRQRRDDGSEDQVAGIQIGSTEALDDKHLAAEVEYEESIPKRIVKKSRNQKKKA